jgi:tetratricopeptide (TPR) repeat protein
MPWLFLAATLAAQGQQSSSLLQAPDAKLSSARAAHTLAEQLAHAPTDERIYTFERILRASPDDFQLQIGLVAAYLQKTRESADFAYVERAASVVNAMLEKDGGNFSALRFQNEIDLQRHNFRAVAERAESMTKYAPSDAGAWGNLGDASMELGEYDRAGQAYLKMFSLRPNLGSYNRLAYWRFVTGDGSAAISLMQSAVAAGDPVPENTAWCLAELGDMYFKLGKVTEAAQSYSSALKTFATLHRALAGLGKTEASLGHTEAAIQSYKRAQSIVPLVEYAGALQDLYTAAGMTTKAKEQQDLIATIETIGRATNEKTNRNLALLLADHDRDLSLASDLMRTEIAVRPDVYTWDAWSWVLFKGGRLDEAKAASAKAIRLGTPEPLFYYHANKIAIATGDVKAARLHTDRLMALNPRFDFAKTPAASPAVQ